MIQIITDLTEYKKLISSGLVVVDFSAVWCGPCKRIYPEYKKCSESSTYTDIHFYKVDVDDSEEIAQFVNIRQMPTFIFYKDNVEVERQLSSSKELLISNLDKFINQDKDLNQDQSDSSDIHIQTDPEDPSIE